MLIIIEMITEYDLDWPWTCGSITVASITATVVIITIVQRVVKVLIIIGIVVGIIVKLNQFERGRGNEAVRQPDARWMSRPQQFLTTTFFAMNVDTHSIPRLIHQFRDINDHWYTLPLLIRSLREWLPPCNTLRNVCVPNNVNDISSFSPVQSAFDMSYLKPDARFTT